VPESASGEAGTGILRSLRNLGATLVALLHTRFELLVTELEEERIRLLQLLFWAAGALFFLCVGMLLLTLLLVVVFWDTHRIAAIAVLAGAFLAAGVGMAIGVRNRMYARSRIFSASLNELARDRDQLTSR
jgi:uncharacterized membrane protein YqjE